MNRTQRCAPRLSPQARLLAAGALAWLALPASAGTALSVQSVPSLDDAGLLVLSALVGLAAGWAVRRGKKK